MTSAVAFAGAVVAVYVLFLLWYGGNGRPLRQDEIDHFLRTLGAQSDDARSELALQEIRALVQHDDGKEFVMQNLVRYRAKAAYPPGADFDDDPRAADRRYGRAILWPLLRHANFLVFIARRSGSFIEPAGADAWHYVAMVRYRSRRDFLRFAVAAGSNGSFVHKWAAIEKTHVFPVKPLLSLIFVRGAVATLLALVGTVLYWTIR